MRRGCRGAGIAGIRFQSSGVSGARSWGWGSNQTMDVVPYQRFEIREGPNHSRSVNVPVDETASEETMLENARNAVAVLSRVERSHTPEEIDWWEATLQNTGMQRRLTHEVRRIVNASVVADDTD